MNSLILPNFGSKCKSYVSNLTDVSCSVYHTKRKGFQNSKGCAKIVFVTTKGERKRMTTHQGILDFVSESIALLEPANIHWCDGSEKEAETLIDLLIQEGKAIPLNPLLRPNSFLFRTDPSDVARVENRTFIASKTKRDAGPTNNWIHPTELKETMTTLFRGSMKGRTLYVIPFAMGPVASPFVKFGIQITDSPYVVLNMRYMTRMGHDILEAIQPNMDFVPCLHSSGYPLAKGQQDSLWPCAPIEQKYISHFPEERLIWSYGSGYGGNALLGKKCFSLRIASVLARDEGWLAEHMLIIKVTNPEGKVKYFTGAFPSACGKTNLAMLISSLPGWKVETLGDDIAWLRIGKDGRLYAMNPEYGFFGVAPGTSFKTNSIAMQTCAKDTIFTNVALTDDGDVWWEGMSKTPPTHLTDWKGLDWIDHTTPAAHPNSRFTVKLNQCPSLAKEWESPEGVPISGILFGGRRSDTIPLVMESHSWQHGVFFGSIMGSEITAAQITNDYGKVRRDPFAMLPFIGYHAGDYFAHWLSMERHTESALLPKIFMVNWFQKDENQQFIWPGFGENIRVIKWIFERCDAQVSARDEAIGYLPYANDLDTSGLPLTENDLHRLLVVDIEKWKNEVSFIEQYYRLFGDELPTELLQELEQLQHRLKL